MEIAFAQHLRRLGIFPNAIPQAEQLGSEIVTLEHHFATRRQ